MRRIVCVCYWEHEYVMYVFVRVYVFACHCEACTHFSSSSNSNKPVHISFCFITTLALQFYICGNCNSSIFFICSYFSSTDSRELNITFPLLITFFSLCLKIHNAPLSIFTKCYFPLVCPPYIPQTLFIVFLLLCPQHFQFQSPFFNLLPTSFLPWLPVW